MSIQNPRILSGLSSCCLRSENSLMLQQFLDLEDVFKPGMAHYNFFLKLRLVKLSIWAQVFWSHWLQFFDIQSWTFCPIFGPIPIPSIRSSHRYFKPSVYSMVGCGDYFHRGLPERSTNSVFVFRSLSV